MLCTRFVMLYCIRTTDLKLLLIHYQLYPFNICVVAQPFPIMKVLILGDVLLRLVECVIRLYLLRQCGQQ